MRVIAANNLQDFWTRRPDAKASLSHWHKIAKAANWTSMNDVQTTFPKAKVLNADRVRFDIAGGEYRFTVASKFKSQSQIAFIKFVGTHAEYDKIDALTVSAFQEGRMIFNPVTNKKEHKAALAEIARLWDAPEGSKESFKLDILATLVERYESKHFVIETEGFDPIDTLNYLINEGGHTQAELGEIIGSRSRASEVLNRKRALTVDMIQKISAAWKVPADLLVQPYDLVRVAQ